MRSAQEIFKEPYARILIPTDDGTYSAEVLEFPGCYAEGDTPAQAIGNLESAAISWIEAAVEQGQEIPPPIAAHGYSGKINLRLPKSIHKQAACFAQKDDVSLNQFFISAIAARVGAEEFYDHLVRRLEGRFAAPTALNIDVQQVFNLSFWQPYALQQWMPFTRYTVEMPPPSDTTIVLDQPSCKVIPNA
jgi:predicted RNase H-like HicB family nuclease